MSHDVGNFVAFPSTSNSINPLVESLPWVKRFLVMRKRFTNRLDSPCIAIEPRGHGWSKLTTWVPCAIGEPTRRPQYRSWTDISISSIWQSTATPWNTHCRKTSTTNTTPLEQNSTECGKTRVKGRRMWQILENTNYPTYCRLPLSLHLTPRKTWDLC